MTEVSEFSPWNVFDYEAYMYLYTYVLVNNFALEGDNIEQQAIKNSYVESLMLHTRILSEILITKQEYKSDDINIDSIIPSEKQSNHLEKLLIEFKTAYGKSNEVGGPRWTLNKMLAHATPLRGSYYNYDHIIEILHPLLLKIIEEIFTLTNDHKIKQYLDYYVNNKNKVT